MKKLLVVLLSLAMVFSLTACSNNNDGENTNTDAPSKVTLKV